MATKKVQGTLNLKKLKLTVEDSRHKPKSVLSFENILPLSASAMTRRLPQKAVACDSQRSSRYGARDARVTDSLGQLHLKMCLAVSEKERKASRATVCAQQAVTLHNIKSQAPR